MYTGVYGLWDGDIDFSRIVSNQEMLHCYCSRMSLLTSREVLRDD